jgi:hypothetical protein
MPNKRTEKEYAEFGRAVSSIFESGAISKKELYKASFLRGMVSGVGGVIGATLVIAILLWLLSLTTNIPLIGRFADKVEDTINTRAN